MRIVIDRAICIGAGNCVRAASEVFDQDDEAIVTLLDEHPSPEHWRAVLQAVQTCPSQAISTVDD